MKKAEFRGVVFVVAGCLLCLTLAGCSKSKETESAKGGGQTTTEQTTNAVREYGKKPIDKARAAQQLGDERTNAIDEAARTR